MATLGKALAVALTDGFVTFLWVMVTSSFGVATVVLGDMMEWEGDRTALLYSLIFTVNLVFAELAAATGGAVWNPTVPMSFYVAGASQKSILEVALRVPGIISGSAAGIVTVHWIMPVAYHRSLGPGPYLKVMNMHHGALVEGMLAFTQTFVVLVVVLRGTSKRYLQSPMIVTSALTLVKLGRAVTGPGINPSDSFAWAFYRSSHASVEHVYVYWMMPFAGALLAASVFRVVVGVPGVKVRQLTQESGIPEPGDEMDSNSGSDENLKED